MPTRRQTLAAAAGAAVLFGGARAAPAAAYGPTLPARALRADIGLLKRAYDALHPGLLRYNTPAGLDAAWARLDRVFSRDQSLGEAYLALSRHLATIRCGHTYANFFNQKKAVVEALFARRDKLPFAFRWIDGRMIATGGGETFGIARGDEILSVDGVAAPRILEALLPLVRADGGNDGKRRSLLSMQANDGIETFDVFYALVFGARDERLVRARAAGGSVRKILVPTIDLAARRAASPRPEPAKDAPQWTLLSAAPGVFRLVMPGWAVYNSTWDWKGFLDGVFDRLAAEKAAALVVDLRGNEGGLDCGNEIIARLVDRPVDLIPYERRVRYRRTPADLDPILDTWDDGFRETEPGARDLGDGFFALPAGGENPTRIEPEGPRFRGKVLVLIDSGCSSATFGFAQCVRANGLGVLVGETTGGNQRGINGGRFFFVRLPETGLEADLPLIGYFPPGSPPDAGLPPDVAVVATAADIAAGRDVVLERALALSGA